MCIHESLVFVPSVHDTRNVLAIVMCCNTEKGMKLCTMTCAISYLKSPPAMQAGMNPIIGV